MNIKKVCLILSQEKDGEEFAPLREKVVAKGVLWEQQIQGKYVPEQETLYVTDLKEVLKDLITQKLPVLAYLHEGNRGQDFFKARYACEQPHELEPEYLERVYRRFAGQPWDILETERCILRESVEEDVEAFYQIYADPAIAKYMDDLYESPLSGRNYIREYIEKMYAYYEFGIWTVVLKETGEIIGRAGLSVREGYELPELGYVIGVPWPGRGLAKEVCQAVLEYAWEEFGFDEVQAFIKKENQPSQGLITALGFREQSEYSLFDENTKIFVRSRQ